MISAAMMVKNEEANIRGCLESLQGKVDEICVMDTGSTDSTMEICKEFDVDLWEFPWPDDFSLARNKSIERARGDWILVIDADERLHDDENILEKVLPQIPDHYNGLSVTLLDMVWRNLEEGQEPYTRVRTNQNRLFRKGSVEYVGLVHNFAVFENESLFVPKVYIKHYGYDLPPEARERKWWRTMHLLQKRHEANPYDFPVWFHFAQMYSQKAEWEKTVHWGTRYISKRGTINDFNPSIYYVVLRAMMELGELEDAKALLKKALSVIPYCVDLGRFMMDLGVAIESSNMVAEGARRFIAAYDLAESQGQVTGGRFIYNHNKETLGMALFRYALITLDDGRKMLERLMGLLADENIATDYRTQLKKDLERETAAIGMTVKVSEGRRADDGIQNQAVHADEIRRPYK